MSFLASRPNKAANRRRSQRILLSINISVEGQTSAGQAFTETTKTSAARHQPRRHPEITSIKTGDTSMATVVDLPTGAEAGAEVGVELQKPSPRFWRVAFSPEDWSTRSPEAKRFDSRVPDDAGPSLVREQFPNGKMASIEGVNQEGRGLVCRSNCPTVESIL